jgi:hypothetical protein
MNQRNATARFIGFEDVIWQTPGFAHLKQRRKVADLQILAGLVWARERGKGKCPTVKPIPDGKCSWWVEAKREVQLVPAHRSVGGLLHELAHALGVRDKYDHGPAFQRRCLRLYKTYGDWSGAI